jgi:hypothetical protein
VKTIIADAQQRVTLPDVLPNQVLLYENINGHITLTPVETKSQQETFPEGTLAQYVTKERNDELLTLVNGCTFEKPE